ncbi:MAG: hypothetical protein U0271_47650 [Polyangiaceae bacterium]
MADLEADCRAAVERPYDDLRSDLKSHLTAQPLAIALLLRLGRVELALAQWNALVAFEPAREMLSDFGFAPFGRAIRAHTVGNDWLAVRSAELAQSVIPVVPAEAARLPHRLRFHIPAADVLDNPALYMRLNGTLLRDATRRTTAELVGGEQRPSSLGDLDVPSLIARLDQVAVDLDYSDWREDAIVRATLAKGQAAVLPLLDCLTQDERLTRSSGPTWSSSGRDRFVRSVQELAFYLLVTILDLPPDGKIAGGHPSMAETAAAIRQYYEGLQSPP